MTHPTSLITKAWNTPDRQLVERYGDLGIYRSYDISHHNNLVLSVSVAGLLYLFGEIIFDQEGQMIRLFSPYKPSIRAAILRENPQFPFAEAFTSSLGVPSIDKITQREYSRMRETVFIHEDESALLFDDGTYNLFRCEKISTHDLSEPQLIKSGKGGCRIKTEGLRYCCAIAFETDQIKALIHAQGDYAHSLLLPHLLRQFLERSKENAPDTIYHTFCEDGLRSSGANPLPYLDVSRQVTADLGISPKIDCSIDHHTNAAIELNAHFKYDR